MAKYYVMSGELQCVIGAPHIACPRQAACEAILMNKDKNLAPLIIVNECGFDLYSHADTEDTVLATVEILKEAGLIQ
jgi:hypothetical protein